jgi:hypothetical protein
MHHSRPFTVCPHWGLFGGAILWILIFIFMIFAPQTPHGLLVSLRSHEVVVWEKSPRQETLAVYLESVVNLAVFVQKWPKIQHFS